MSLAGKTVAFTGEMVGMTRKEASAIAQAAGAAIGSATSKNIDFLFAGSGATPAKTMKAQQNGVNVIPAPQFSQMTAGFKAAAPVMAAPAAVSYPAAFAPTKAPRGRRPASAMMAPAQPMMMAQPTYVQPMQFVPYVAATQPVFSHQAVALPGKKVCFTGAFDSGNRAQVGEFAEKEGAMVHPHVQADTDILVCGFAAHETKLAAAKAMGVRCITEQQFTAAMRAAVPAPMYAAAAPMAAAPMMAKAPRAPRAPRAFAAPLPTVAASAAPITLAGQNVVFTGALQVNRFVASTMVSKAGGVPQSSLNSSTNLLVCGANAGPKVAKAQAMGVRCIGEAEFVAACRI